MRNTFLDATLKLIKNNLFATEKNWYKLCKMPKKFDKWKGRDVAPWTNFVMPKQGNHDCIGQLLLF
jgi:hypothetical protein